MENKLQSSGTNNTGVIPTAVPIIAGLLAASVVFIHLAGKVWLPAAFEAVQNLSFIAIIFVSAGGYGVAVLKRITPKDSPRGLVIVSAIALGLWLFSSAMLVVGSIIPGSLTPIVWWPVILFGVFLSCWQGRDAMKNFRLPGRVSRWSLLWVVFGASAAIWLVGATRPPGFIGVGDVYDVLEYHLQVPREFFIAGQIGPLQHNAYSYFPLGLEMLYLMAMCLLGGAYEGMYLAQFFHGAFGCLAVAALLCSFGQDNRNRIRGRFAAAMLASAPAVIYLSWLAFVELSMICYLTLAVLWLRVWLGSKSLRASLCIGIMIGAACAMKYISIGIIAGPVLFVMLLASIISRKRLAGTVIAGLIGLVLFCPWLIRNYSYTGNPVFPLATKTLGRAHWSAETQQRWQAGHGPANLPPVPQPAGWQDSANPRPTRLKLAAMNFMASDYFNKAIIFLAIGSVIALLIPPGFSGKVWDFALAGIVFCQAGIWYALAHDMPWRFMAPALVPLVLLAGGGLSRLMHWNFNPLKLFPATSKLAKMNWAIAPAMGIFIAILILNLFYDTLNYANQNRSLSNIPPWSGESIATSVPPYSAISQLDPKAKVMLVGDAAAFYYPPNTIYATAFDNHPLDELARKSKTDAELLKGLRELGVSHIVVNWPEVLRLSRTYGYPASLSDGLQLRLERGEKPTLPVLERLKAVGVKEDKIGFSHGKGVRGASSLPAYTVYVLP